MAQESGGGGSAVAARPPVIKKALIAGVIIAVLLALGVFGMTWDRKPTPELLREKRTAYLESHQDLKPEVREAIQKGDLVEGMTLQQVRASVVANGFGLRNRLRLYKVTKGLKGEISVYEDHQFRIMGFRDGVLFGITQSGGHVTEVDHYFDVDRDKE